MKRLTRLLFSSFLAIALVLCAGLARADLYWETVTTQQGGANASASGKLSKHYLSSSTYRIEQPESIVIMDYDTMSLYQLRPADKTYVKRDMTKMGMGPKMGNLKGNRRQNFQKFMKKMMKMEVTPTNETKTIDGYKCRKYLVSMMMMEQEMWVTKDIEAYDEFKALYHDMAKKIEGSPMLQMTNMAAMVDKVDGFPLRTITKAMGSTQVTTVKKIEEKKLDKNLFTVPKDYREISVKP